MVIKSFDFVVAGLLNVTEYLLNKRPQSARGPTFWRITPYGIAVIITLARWTKNTSIPDCQTVGLCSGRQAFTDFGFKKLFGSEFNKEFLIDFLNQILGDIENIKDLTYLNTENLGNSRAEEKPSSICTVRMKGVINSSLKYRISNSIPIAIKEFIRASYFLIAC